MHKLLGHGLERGGTVSYVSERGVSTPVHTAGCGGAQAGSPAPGACGKTSKPGRCGEVRLYYALPSG